MAVYKTFKNGELLHTVIRAAPEIVYSTGSSGAASNYSIRPDGALSLYGGVRERVTTESDGVYIKPLDDVDTHSIDKVIQISGSYPATGSISFYTVHDDSRVETGTRKGQARFRAIEGLFRYYSQLSSNYSTASHDYYSLFFQHTANTGSTTALALTSSTGDPALSSITDQITVEANIRWLPRTQYVTGSRYTVAEQRQNWSLYLSNVSGTLFFADGNFATIVSSSYQIPSGTWHHVAVSAGAGSASFYVDGQRVSTASFTGSFTGSAYLPIIGATMIPIGGDPQLEYYDSYKDGFYGNMHEVRIWNVARTPAQISGTWNRSLTTTEKQSSNLKVCMEFRNGPGDFIYLGQQGFSASFDSSPSRMSAAFMNFQEEFPLAPIWQPNDNEWFTTTKVERTDPVDHMAIVEIPSMFYGRQISTGSFKLRLNAYDKHMSEHVVVDDGRGGLYVSGSSCLMPRRDERAGVKWRRVGNIFYTEGIAAITDPAITDLFEARSYNSTVSYTVLQSEINGLPLRQVSFKGDQRIASKVFMCRLGPAEANGSNNPTYSEQVSDDDFGERREIRRPTNTTYITSVGIYDSERKLVAVAKLAQPIRKREKDKLNIRLRMDF